MSVEETKKSVLLRVKARPSFEVVPAHAIALFDRVIEETDAEASAAHPDDEWGRVQFWKDEILRRVAPTLRGMIAGQYHEYIASLRRGDDGLETDTYGFDDLPPYGGEARAQRDAYLACTASLA